MANIITPGNSLPAEEENPPKVPETTVYLKRDNYLREYADDENVYLIRDVLNVPSKDEVYNENEILRGIINEAAKKIADEAVNEHLNQDDPHGIKAAIDTRLENDEYIVKSNKETYFTKRVSGPNPTEPLDFVNKSTLENTLNQSKKEVTSAILTKVAQTLVKYIKLSDLSSKVYTKQQVDNQALEYAKLKQNNQFTENNSFTKPVIGADPRIDSHLSTKRYVDKVMNNHLTDIDPHGFISRLNERLKSYIKANQVYDRAHTYSRDQLDSIIRSLVHDAAVEAINDHLNETDPHDISSKIQKEEYVKQDGTTPFRSVQKGVDAEDDADLVTYRQLLQSKQDLENKIANKESIWITSGPVEVQVGMVKEGDTLASSVTFQEAMDAIFYGKRVKLTVPELVNIGQVFPITLCIQGSLATVEYAEIWQDGEYLTTITKEQFEESSCVTVDGLPIESNSEITAKVFYTNGSIHEVTEIVKIALPVFIGIIPRWKFGNTVSYNQLLELHNQDSENNKFYNKGIHLQSIEHSFNFDEDKEQKIIVALPKEYNNLVEMSNSAQAVSGTAFEVIDQIPFQIPGSTTDIIYKLYFYKQDLYSLNTTMNFKFA